MQMNYLEIVIAWIETTPSVVYAWLDHHEHPTTIHVYHRADYRMHYDPMPIPLASLKIELHRAPARRHPAGRRALAEKLAKPTAK